MLPFLVMVYLLFHTFQPADQALQLACIPLMHHGLHVHEGNALVLLCGQSYVG